MVIIGASFTEVGSSDGLLLDNLKGTFASFDSIQVSLTDEGGKTQLKDYYYSKDGDIDETDGWYNQDYEYIGNTEYLPWGRGAWLVAADPTDLTTAGEVTKGHRIHAMEDPMTLVSSCYPTPFCPNSATVSWNGIASFDSIQTFYTDENNKTQLRDYYYSLDGDIDETDGWYNQDYELLEADQPIGVLGEGFWLVLESFDGAAFTEVSPLGDVEAK